MSTGPEQNRRRSRQGHAELSVAAIYADAHNRMLIERQLRAQFNPPCGLI